MKKTLKAYLAGIIDGEGYVGIKRSMWGQRNRTDVNCPTYSERLQIKLSNKPENKQVLQYFKNYYGGRLYEEPKIYKSKGGFNTNYSMVLYQATDKIAITIINDLFSYLIIKKPQAILLRKLRKSKESILAKRRGSPKGTKMSKVVIDYRENLWKQIKLIHKPKLK